VLVSDRATVTLVPVTVTVMPESASVAETDLAFVPPPQAAKPATASAHARTLTTPRITAAR